LIIIFLFLIYNMKAEEFEGEINESL
jgi:hypothetical protein